MTVEQVKVITDGALEAVVLRARKWRTSPAPWLASTWPRTRSSSAPRSGLPTGRRSMRQSAGKPAPPAPESARDTLNFPIKGKSWDPVTNPVAFTWLPMWPTRP